MKANSLDKPWAKWVVLALYVITVVFLASRHEPWGDEYHVWHMTYSMSLGELISSMRVEGHFCLWHLCVWPWVKLLGMDYHALYVASISLMTIAVWLLLFKVEFSFVGKLFVIFSAPFIYHFPVIARCYALIPPITIGLTAVYQQKKSPFIFCFLLGLLAHTHAYMEGLVAILWFLFVYYYVIKIWNKDLLRARRNLKASLITIVLVCLAFLQILGSVIDAHNGIGPAFSSSNSDDGWLVYFHSYHRIRIFNTLRLNLWEHLPNLDLSITLLIYLTILWFLFEILHKQKKEYRGGFILLLLVPAIWQILFATNIYSMGFQRVYLICIPIYMFLGMVYSQPSNKHATYILMLFWLINSPCQYVIAKDLTGEYNYDARCASEIESHLPEIAEIATTGEVSCIRLLKRKFHKINDFEDSYKIENEITTFVSTHSPAPCFLITTEVLDTLSFHDFILKPIYKGIEGNSEISGIQYESQFTLYLIEHEENN